MNLNQKNRSPWRNNYLKEILLASLIAFTPLFIYVHLLFSHDSNNFSIFGISIIHNFENNQIFTWFLLKDFIPILLLVTWFFTSSKKWKYALFLIIFYFFYSIIENLNVDSSIGIFVFLIFIFSIMQLDRSFFKKQRLSKVNASLKELLDFQLKSNYKSFQIKSLELSKDKKKNSFKEYLSKIYYLKSKLSSYLNKRNTHDIVRQPKVFVDWIFLSSLIICFLIGFSHRLISAEQEAINLGFTSIRNNGFADLNTFIWFLSIKLMLCISMSVWFISERSWWKYSILSSIVLYSYQFWEACQDQKYLDAFGNIKALPTLLLIIFILLLLSRVVKYHIGLLDLYYDLNLEIEQLFKQLGSSDINKKVYNLKYHIIKEEFRTSEDSKQHLRDLLNLREELLKNKN